MAHDTARLDLDLLQSRQATFTPNATAGELALRAVPYGQTVDITPQMSETFTPGAFDRASRAAHRVKLYDGHTASGGRLIGHALEVVSDPTGVALRMMIADTAAGREARTLVEAGSYDQASIEFRALPGSYDVTRRDDGGMHVTHNRAHLMGVALVPHGAYDTETDVELIRAARAQRSSHAALLRLRALSH